MKNRRGLIFVLLLGAMLLASCGGKKSGGGGCGGATCPLGGIKETSVRTEAIDKR